MEIKTNGVHSNLNLTTMPNNKETTPTSADLPVLDSGNRRQFDSGAVRDIQVGKGRFDLMPLEHIYRFLGFYNDYQGYAHIYGEFAEFQKDDSPKHIFDALSIFVKLTYPSVFDALLELSKHYEAGAVKYGERNWEKGIPIKSYIDSALRHLTKYLRGDKDEPHDRAFMWNCFAILWTADRLPEMPES